ncbi:hypothetical protein [Tychonema sp. LEGE 06208]|uniref:hypothetical protein n=1 Tax=Tychonema sp. LEGE 06208 TaxID=1828663 RepID=UPI00187F5230|nr:hypothetical protein [Tychonema sp. LEGE 06208]MBE9163827.1 hypothetical protein [Tychonema sp. LEGE 06208]
MSQRSRSKPKYLKSIALHLFEKGYRGRGIVLECVRLLSAGSVGECGGVREEFLGYGAFMDLCRLFDEAVSTSVQNEERNRRQIGAD